MSVRERVREVGILKTLGHSGGDSRNRGRRISHLPCRRCNRVRVGCRHVLVVSRGPGGDFMPALRNLAVTRIRHRSVSAALLIVIQLIHSCMERVAHFNRRVAELHGLTMAISISQFPQLDCAQDNNDHDSSRHYAHGCCAFVGACPVNGPQTALSRQQILTHFDPAEGFERRVEQRDYARGLPDH